MHITLAGPKIFADLGVICVGFLKCANEDCDCSYQIKNGILNGLFHHLYDIFRNSKDEFKFRILFFMLISLGYIYFLIIKEYKNDITIKEREREREAQLFLVLLTLILILISDGNFDQFSPFIGILTYL